MRRPGKVSPAVVLSEQANERTQLMVPETDAPGNGEGRAGDGGKSKHLSLFGLDQFPAGSRPERKYVVDHLGELLAPLEPSSDGRVKRDKMLALIRALFAIDPDGIRVNASWSKLVEETDVSEKTLRRAADAFKRKDLLIVLPRIGVAGQAENSFQILYTEAGRRLPGFRAKFPPRCRPVRAVVGWFASAATWLMAALLSAAATARGRAATARGRAATARPPIGDPRHDLKNEMKTHEHDGSELQKFAGNNWPSGVEAAALYHVQTMQAAFECAARVGWVRRSEQDRLGVFAAAVQARGGTRNRPGLYRYLVEGRRWNIKPGETRAISEAAFDEARKLIRELDRPRAESGPRDHPDLIHDSGPAPLGQSAAKLLGLPSPASAGADVAAPPRRSKEQLQAELHEWERKRSHVDG